MLFVLKIVLLVMSFQHFFFMYFEMFAWQTMEPRLFKKLPKDQFTDTRSMAQNQGLYNGFLAAGLLWSLFIKDPHWFNNIALFFSSCVLVAGMVGAVTVQRSIFFVQGLPAIIALILFELPMLTNFKLPPLSNIPITIVFSHKNMHWRKFFSINLILEIILRSSFG